MVVNLISGVIFSYESTSASKIAIRSHSSHDAYHCLPHVTHAPFYPNLCYAILMPEYFIARPSGEDVHPPTQFF